MGVYVAHVLGEFAYQLDIIEDTQVFEDFKATYLNAFNSNLNFAHIFGMTNWTKNPLTLGAYSYFAPSNSNKNDPEPLKARSQMSKPPENKVFFAGEAYNMAA